MEAEAAARLSEAQELHRRAFVADAHADSLMWNRDLARRCSSGHVDFPRLREAGVKLQCFTLVTRGLPFIGGFPLFVAWRRWPAAARRGEWARALWQIEQLERYCRATGGQVRLTDSAEALRENRSAGRISAVLGVEGAHALEGQVDRVGELWRRGARFMSLTHLSNNALGGSSFPGMGNRPLTRHGHDVLDEMARLGMAVDVAHASSRTLEDILAHPRARPMCSHTGARAEGGGWRNLPDQALRRIADRGGVVGIIFATVYLGGRSADDVARHVAHAVDVMGEDAVAFGSDFDGMVPLPNGMQDVTGLPLITAALLQRRMPERLVEKIIGDNWRRFFTETLDGVPR
ncbi:MAG TPA: membrane dipeptidase [Myxococcaceae bacterium]|nr:membrane dipeptidase [Myxococcaceae bacterium]